jgi:hypothetical protein
VASARRRSSDEITLAPSTSRRPLHRAASVECVSPGCISELAPAYALRTSLALRLACFDDREVRGFLARLLQRPDQTPTWLIMVAAVLGAALGPALMLADYRSWGPDADEVRHSGEFLLWVSLLGAQTMLWTLAAPLLGATLWRNREGWSAARCEIALSAAILFLIVVGIAFAPRVVRRLPEVIPSSGERILVLTVGALLVSVLAAIAIWLIRGRLATIGQQERPLDDVQRVIELRGDLERMLLFLGAVVGLAVL